MLTGIKCPHRGAVFSYHARHIFYPYGENEREACNVFFVWELLRPLIKGIKYFLPSLKINDYLRLNSTLLCNRMRCHFRNQSEAMDYRLVLKQKVLAQNRHGISCNSFHLWKKDT